MKPEWIALVMNSVIFGVYVWQWQEPGKILYWGGTVVIVGGLLLMRG